MKKAHPKNERIKRKYLQWLETAKGMTPGTADQVAAAIAAFEKSTSWKDFAAFHIEQPQKFQRDLKAAINEKTGKPLAKSTIRSRLMAVKAFCKWLADQQGYKSRISHSDCEYFNMTANDRRIATARRERRDVFQDARLVKTKNAKTMTTSFFPVGGDAAEVVSEWVNHLRSELLYAPTEPLFPKTETGLNSDGVFAASGLKREYWSDAAAIRRIFRERFEAAGLPYFHPHSLRKTLMQIAFRKKLDPEALKAWSQNLGHEELATSLNAYGKVPDQRTSEIMSDLATQSDTDPSNVPPEVLKWVQKQTQLKS